MTTGNYFSLTPSIEDALSFGWKKIGEQFLPLLAVTIILAILHGPVSFTYKEDTFQFWHLAILPIFMAYGFLFWPVIDYGGDYLFLNAIRGEKVEIVDLFDGFRTKYLNIVLANLITVALVIMGFILLIIPGIIILCRLVFVSYLVMDKGLEPIRAIEESWKMTRGHGWTIFGLAIISFLIFIAGLILLFVGIFFSLMLIHASFATLYQAILNQEDKSGYFPIIETTITE